MVNLRTCAEKVLSFLWVVWIRWKGCTREIVFKLTPVTGETVRRDSNAKNPEENTSKTWMTISVVFFSYAIRALEEREQLMFMS